MGGLLAFAITMFSTVRVSSSAQIGLDLVVERCTGIDADEVRRIVGVELRTSLSASTAAAPTVQVRCEDEAADVVVADPFTRKTTSRRFDLGASAPLARNRALALGIAEILRWSWAELNMAPMGAPVSTEGKPAAPVPVEATVEARSIGDRALEGATQFSSHERLRLHMMGSGRAMFSGVRPLLGVGVRVSHEQIRSSLYAELTGEWGLSQSLSVEAGSWAPVVLETQLFSTALGAQRVWRGTSGSLGLGAGARVGLANLKGTPTDRAFVPRGTSGLWAGPMVSMSAAYVISRSVQLTVAAEGGWAIVGVTGQVADLSTTANFSGAFIGSSLGLGFAP